MNPKLKKTLLTLATTLSAILIVTTATYAIGTLTPSGTAGDDTQVSLNDIYTKLVDFSDTPTATSSPFVVPGTLSSTFHTLTEIYDLLNSENSDLVPENVATGTTIFGVEGIMERMPAELEWSTYQGEGVYSDAVLACSVLTEGGVNAGDWRLPTILEYQAITDYTIFANATHVLGFNQESTYHSSTVNVSTANNTWGWYPYEGVFYSLSSDTTSWYRCVR